MERPDGCCVPVILLHGCMESHQVELNLSLLPTYTLPKRKSQGKQPKLDTGYQLEGRDTHPSSIPSCHPFQTALSP